MSLVSFLYLRCSHRTLSFRLKWVGEPTNLTQLTTIFNPRCWALSALQQKQFIHHFTCREKTWNSHVREKTTSSKSNTPMWQELVNNPQSKIWGLQVHNKINTRLRESVDVSDCLYPETATGDRKQMLALNALCVWMQITVTSHT